MLYSGSLNVYFPCKLREKGILKDTIWLWKRFRKRQKRIIHVRSMPLSNLTDLNKFRNENESIIGRYCLKRFGEFIYNRELLPYALPCLQKVYRHSVGDNVYIKVANVVLSRFCLSYDNIPNKKIDGILLCNINLDNTVATYTIMLNFKNIEIDEIILLKHLFYKRALVEIEEYEIDLVCSECKLNKNEACCFKCIKTKGIITKKKQTFQDFVLNKRFYKTTELELTIDTKARYSLLSLDEPLVVYPFLNQRNEIIKGLMTADYGYMYDEQSKDGVFESISRRKSYNYYLYHTHGLISIFPSLQIEYVKRCNELINRIIIPDYHIKRELRIGKSCIAGVEVNQFPSYMRAVELHYLINSVLANDIIPREQSYFNPLVFIQRGFRLWKIIYELDINKYYASREVFKSFNIEKNMKDIKDEYRTILTHGVAYFALLISLVSLIITILIK